MNKEDKINKIKELDSIELLGAYNLYHDKFNPLDDDWIESFEIIKNEILSRMKKGENK